MEFLQPRTLKEAGELLATHPGMTILGGGTDVVVRRRAGKLDPEGFLDVTRIAELREIRCGDRVFLGAAVTCAELERSAALQAACPLLVAAAASVGSPQIRSRATVGGNVANASPAADLIPALTAAGAVAVVERAGGTRRAAVPELVRGPSQCALVPGELIRGFELPVLTERSRWSFDKIGRRNALAIARMNGAVVWTMEGARMTEIRLCIGASTDRPCRFEAAERILEGQRPESALFYRAGQAVREELLARTGVRASSAYKLPVAADFTVRLLERAMGRN